MGETTKPQGDTTSVGGSGITSTETQTFTKETVDALVSKTRSDALAEVGRLRKAADDANKVAQSAIQRIQKMEDDRFKAEEESVKDDPEKLSTLTLRRQAWQIKTQAEEAKQKIDEERAELQTQRREVLTFNAERLAEKYNVTQETLLEYGGQTREAMEKLAKSYGEKVTSEGEKTKRLTDSPDSGKTKGSSGKLRYKDVEDYSTQGKNTQQIMKDAEEILTQFTK